MQGADQPEVLVRGRDDLVTRIEIQPCEDDVAAVGRGRGQRDLFRLRTDEVGKLGAQFGSKGEDALDVFDPHPALAQVSPLLGSHRLGRPAGERPCASRLQIGDLLEHRKLGACLLEGHARESTVRIRARSAGRPTGVYTSVRPVAGSGARACGSGCRARHVALSVRGRRTVERIRRSRVVLSALFADGSVPSTARGEGPRASARHAAARRPQAGHPAPAVVRRA